MKTLICAAIEVQSVAVKHGHRTIHMTNSLKCLLLDKISASIHAEMAIMKLTS